MKTCALACLLAIGGPLLSTLPAGVFINSGVMRSPENQVFQFVQRSTFVYTADDEVTTAAYLWIPENCRRLRGLLILGENIPEHGLVGHPAIRAACSASDLGIVWCTPRFISFKERDEAPKTVAFLQQLLDGLAASSGYTEVAIVPWLPMGESMHYRMLYQLLNHSPQRCIAGIFIKNALTLSRYQNRETPVLVAVGTAQEWYQDKTDIRTHWTDLSFYETMLKERAVFPDWPMSILIEAGSGHFDCTEAMTAHFAAYISAVVRARIPTDPSKGLLPVAQSDGFVTGLPLPGRNTFEPTAYAKAEPAYRSMPWFFSETLALDAFHTAAVNWQAASQLPAFVDAQGKAVPMAFRGITRPVPFETGADGITFEIAGCLLPAIPPGFVGAMAPLAIAPGTPTVEWICGSIVPLGQGRFRIALDRTWPKGPICVALRHKGTGKIRDVVQPGYLQLEPNRSGFAQSITFAPIPDQPFGTDSVTLAATSDSGLPVRYFIVAGPAVVEGNILKLTPIPPRTRYPVEITVTAWQWGRSIEPQVRTAATVTRSFHVTESKVSPLR
ncbi:MAG: hypothetical protein Q7S40_17425 [Opitutaceae bacterium]|nr:hypothetical protein [Opitutaceae bacterium]